MDSEPTAREFCLRCEGSHIHIERTVATATRAQTSCLTLIDSADGSERESCRPKGVVLLIRTHTYPDSGDDTPVCSRVHKDPSGPLVGYRSTL